MKKMFLILTMGLIIPISSYATLGSTIKSLPSDTQTVKNTSHMVYVTQTATYKLFQYSNLPVKGYTKSKNIIFAVIWKGISPPNLKEVLGEQNFKIFTTTKPVINTLNYKKFVANDLVIEISGHQGDVFGNAYIPSQMPKNTTIEGLITNAK